MSQCIAPGCERTAAAGLRLCWHDRNRIQVDALDAVELHDELLDIAANGRGAGEGQRVKGGEEKLGIELDPRLVEAREDIRQALHAWAWHIVSYAPRPLLAGTPTSLREAGQFVAAHATWLAANEAAGDASASLRDVVDQAAALVQVDPERSVRTVESVACPECSGELRAVMRRSTSLAPSFMLCEQGHRWLPHQWGEFRAAGEELVDAATAAAALGNTADAVNALARRGRLQRVDTDAGPRYRLRDVQALAKEWGDVTAITR